MTRLNDLQDERRAVAAELERQRARLGELEAASREKPGVQAAIASADQAAADQAARATRAGQAAEEARQRGGRARGRIAELEPLDGQLPDVEARLKASEREIADRTAQLADRRPRLAGAQRSASQARARLVALTGLREELERSPLRRKELEGAAADLAERQGELDRALAAARDRADASQRHAANLEVLRQVRAAELDAESAETARVEQSLRQAEAAHEEFRQAQAEFDRARAALAKFKSKRPKLRVRGGR